MKTDAEEWRTLRREFIEAAAKFDEYETFIVRNESTEDWYCSNGRYSSVGLVRWPHGTLRKCWILAPDSGSDEEPFSVMKTLFNKAWLWLPRNIGNSIVETAELHLSLPPSPPVGTELFWVKSDYQYWCWILWFYWLRQHRAATPSEADKPSKKMLLAPFHRSADLIAQWGLDGGEGTLPEWLAPPIPLDADAPNPTHDSQKATGRTWQDVYAELERLRLKGEAYTSQEKLGKRIGCNKFLVNKAIKKGSAELQEWATKPRGESRLNVSQKASELALNTTPQSREDDPAEVIESEDIDAAMNYLLEQANEHEQQSIKGMTPCQQQELAKIAFRDREVQEQIERQRQAKRSRRK
jgi:hypothetical protein